MATNPATMVRTLLVQTADADPTIRTICGRTSGCMVAASAIAKSRMPAIGIQLVSDRELDGIGDPHEMLITYSVQAEGARALDVAEELAQRVRELLGAIAVVSPQVQACPEDVFSQTIDDSELVPAGRARLDLSVRYRVEVL